MLERDKRGDGTLFDARVVFQKRLGREGGGGGSYLNRRHNQTTLTGPDPKERIHCFIPQHPHVEHAPRDRQYNRNTAAKRAK